MEHGRFAAFCLRHRKQLKTVGILGIVGLGYYFLTQLTPFRIPCLFQKITGLACPGCGVTHFCIRVLHMDFWGAARENLALTVLLPIWIAAAFIRTVWRPKWLQKNSCGEQILLWGSVALLLVFGIVRNLPGMEFLLPSYRQ